MTSPESSVIPPQALILVDVGSTIGEIVAAEFAVRHGWSAVRGDRLDLGVGLKPETVVAVDCSALTPVDVRRRVRHEGHVVWLRDHRGGVEHRSAADLAIVSTAADSIVDVDTSSADWTATAVDELTEAVTRSRGVSPMLEMAMTFADGRRSDIIVGRGASERLSLVVDGARRVAVVTQAGIGLEVDAGVEQRVFEVPDGESAKRMDVVADLASRFAQWGMTRSDMVVAVGGGVVTDLGGFVAATYHRGIPVVHVATTLLGQVDAAIGGKCGVNLPEGKNLVGAFWQPRAVLCEIDALDTLPTREYTSGMGELAKYHFLGGGHLDRLALTERVAQAARIKADVVSVDEREGGRRAILNYGHTLAHALETAAGYGDLRHGEAVGIGLVYAAELARRLGRIGDDEVAEHRRVVTGYGLSDTIPHGYDMDQLVGLFSRDKKAVSGLTFVLDGPDGVEPVSVSDTALLRETLDAVA